MRPSLDRPLSALHRFACRLGCALLAVAVLLVLPAAASARASGRSRSATATAAHHKGHRAHRASHRRKHSKRAYHRRHKAHRKRHSAHRSRRRARRKAATARHAWRGHNHSLVEAPAEVAPPTIGGIAQQGQTLSASTGTWSNEPTSYAYQWQDCNALGEGCLAIAGATASTYTLTASDVGDTMRILVTASNAGGSAQAASAVTGAVEPPAPVSTAPLAPVNTALPAITGSAVEGQTLSASTGTWSNEPTSYAYQWQECSALGEGCLSVAGATSSSYRLGASDVGDTIRVVVTASNAGGSAAASSAQTANVTAPESTGLLLGSAAVQSWGDSSAAGSAEAFQYTATATGTARSLALYVSSGSSAPAIDVGLYSNASGNPGKLLASATISSPASGAWNVVGISPVSLTSGATYWLAALGPNGTLAMRDLASGGGATKTSASSSLTALPASWSSGASWSNSPASFYAAGSVVEESPSPPPPSAPSAPVNTAAPVVSGLAVEGETLTASTGEWTESPSSYAYRWEDCDSGGEGCSSIGGATLSSYTLQSADVGHTVRVVVTAGNAGGSAVATSAATGVVVADPPPAAPVNTGLPVISGVAEEGQTLRASTGSWSGSPTSYAYQWKDCDSTGSACSNISGATSSGYGLKSADVAHTVRVAVTASNEAGASSATSTTTATVVERGSNSAKCFENPGAEGRDTGMIEACGYPGYDNTGPESGTTLKIESAWKGDLEIEAGGTWTVVNNSHGVKLSSSETIEGRRIEGRIHVAASATNARIANDEIITVGLGCPAAKKPACEGNYSFDSIDNQGKDTVISHVAAGGAERTGENVVSECLRSYGDGLKVEYSRFINCDGIKLDDGGTVEHSYCLDNAEIESSEGPAHYECVSDNCSSEFTSPLVLRHNTLFNPHKQTAVIFVQNTYGACHEVVVEDNFLAGGGKSYSGPEAGSNGPEAVVGNRFAFAECMSGEEKRIEGGNWVCAEQEPWAGHEEQFTPQAPGEAGYFPNGGSYTYASHLIVGARHEGNFRDDNLEELAFSDG
jgi:hypothetical protein